MIEKPLTINPFKTSPALGAAYALQGIKGAIPLFHSAPGCTFLGKVLLTQHLREPVGLVGTDIKEMPTIMGGWEELEKKIVDVNERLRPSLIGVIGTALSEVRGEDYIKFQISNFKFQIIYIPCPDYMGGFSDGYAKAIEVLIENLAEENSIIPNQINILPCSSLTIADIEEIKDIVSEFGLKPVVLPDLSISMDGSKERFSSLPLDGTKLVDIKSMGRSSATIAIGEGLNRAGEILRDRFNIPLYSVPIPIGIDAADKFIKCLMDISNKEPPANIKRWRRRLVDCMVDTHLIMADKKIAIGIEGEMLSGIAAFCREMGIEILNFKSQISNFKVNDLEDLEDIAEDADLIITNSHGKEVSERLGIPLLRMGFPVFDRFGETLKIRVGYKGSLNLLFEMANIFYENCLCDKR